MDLSCRKNDPLTYDSLILTTSFGQQKLIFEQTNNYWSNERFTFSHYVNRKAQSQWRLTHKSGIVAYDNIHTGDPNTGKTWTPCPEDIELIFVKDDDISCESLQSWDTLEGLKDISQIDLDNKCDFNTTVRGDYIFPIEKDLRTCKITTEDNHIEDKYKDNNLVLVGAATICVILLLFVLLKLRKRKPAGETKEAENLPLVNLIKGFDEPEDKSLKKKFVPYEDLRDPHQIGFGHYG